MEESKKAKQNIVLILIIASILFFAFFALIFFSKFPQGKRFFEQKIPPPSPPQVTPPLAPREIPAPILPKIERPTRPPELPLPPVVFNTGGKIIQIGQDFILVDGNGSNFEDQKPRTLKVKISQNTITNEKNYIQRYQGFEGLRHLRVGDEISIESLENIREKTEFEASYITKL